MLAERKPTLTPALKYLPDSEVDSRTDAEIEELVSTHRPVKHEKNCWTFWHSGFQNMPRWCKRNVIGWVRRLGPEWDVRCVDMVNGSPTHALNYIEAQYMPECFLKDTMTGKSSPQHASDMVRLPLVYLHGGVWMDSGTVLLRSFDDSFWNFLEDEKCPYEMFVLNFHYRLHKGQILNGLIGARKGNPFVQRWLRVFFELWKGRTDCAGLRYHPLIRHLGLIEGANAERIGIGGPVDNSAHMMVDYLAQDYSFERVRLVVDDAENWDGPEYYRKHICFLNVEREYWKYAALMPTEMHVKLMSLPFKPELTREIKEEELQCQFTNALALAPSPQDQLPGAAALAATPDGDLDETRLQQAARDWLTNISSSCLAVKFSGGYWWPESGWPMPLAVTWVLPDHEDDDIMPGSWAEWFRYASTHLQQTRKVPIYGTHLTGLNGDQSLVPEFLRAEAERVLYAGLLQPALENDGWEFIPPFETS